MFDLTFGQFETISAFSPAAKAVGMTVKIEKKPVWVCPDYMQNMVWVSDSTVVYHPVWKGIKGVKIVHKRYDIVTTSPSRNWEQCEDTMWLMYH
ncbi:hypothetical protein [Planktothrix sp.]|uniref:hypothetical protein n=1 Tax=Planktothrix sp. TaxID=3088171 RepID=UPI0038D36ACE